MKISSPEVYIYIHLCYQLAQAHPTMPLIMCTCGNSYASTVMLYRHAPCYSVHALQWCTVCTVWNALSQINDVIMSLRSVGAWAYILFDEVISSGLPRMLWPPPQPETNTAQ